MSNPPLFVPFDYRSVIYPAYPSVPGNEAVFLLEAVYSG